MRASQRVVTAGPLFSLDDEDGGPVGSLVIFNAEVFAWAWGVGG